MIFGGEQHHLEKNYFKKIVRAACGELHYGKIARQAYIKQFVIKTDIVQLTSGSLVLDAGCGKGELIFSLACKVKNVNFIGIDINQKLISADREIMNKLNLKNVYFKVQDLGEIDYVSRFDVIFCVDVLEHIKNDEKVIWNFHRALKPGGKLILHVPQKGKYLSPKFGFRRLKRDTAYDRNTSSEIIGVKHVRKGYEREYLRSLLERRGFSVLNVRNTFGFIVMIGHTLFEIIRPFSKIYWLIVKPLLTLFLFFDLKILSIEGGGLLMILERL